MNVLLVGMSPKQFKSCRLHSHSSWEIVLNLEGEGLTRIGDKDYAFGPGTIICHPPNTLHAKRSDQDCRDIYIQVKEFINPVKNELLILQDDESKSIEALFFLALRIYQKKETNYASILDSLYDTIYQLFISRVGCKSQNPAVGLFKNQLIENFTDPEFQIASVISQTMYSSDHFRRCFKKDTGMSPITYLIHLRVEHAKRLLKQQAGVGLAISEIAYLSGFYDPRYFSRIFKEKVGMTPREYAEEIQQELQKETEVPRSSGSSSGCCPIF